MESQSKAGVSELPDQGGDGNDRSSISFAYTDLNNASEVVKGVHAVGGTACEYEQLAAHLGVEAKGGGYRLRVNGATTYGLINYQRGGRITLTDLGRKMIDPQQERSARVEAFLAVPLFKRVYDEFKGSPLPPQAGLERAIVNFGVGPKVADRARQVLLRSAKQAGFFELAEDRLTQPPLRAGEASPPPPEKEKEKSGSNGGGSGTQRVVSLKSGGTLTLSASIDLFKMSSSDRTFVFGLIDKLDEYEKEPVDPMS
jgi:hypothetical protein